MNIDQMRMIVGVDDRFTQVQLALSDLAESFEANISDPAAEVNIEDVLATLDEIVSATTRMTLLIAPPAKKKQESSGAKKGTRRRGRTWDFNGENLTFAEIAARHPNINTNTLHYRLDRLGDGWTADEVIHGKPDPATALNGSDPPD